MSRKPDHDRQSGLLMLGFGVLIVLSVGGLDLLTLVAGEEGRAVVQEIRPAKRGKQQLELRVVYPNNGPPIAHASVGRSASYSRGEGVKVKVGPTGHTMLHEGFSSWATAIAGLLIGAFIAAFGFVLWKAPRAAPARETPSA